MASKHVSSMDRTTGTPYRKALSSTERTALQQEVAKKLQQMAARLQKEEEDKAAASAAPTAEADAVSQAVPKTPPRTSRSLPFRPSSRPTTSAIPLHTMVMQRPAASRPVTSSWSGPLSGLAEQQRQAKGAAEVWSADPRPPSRLGTPSSRANVVRRSLPASMPSGLAQPPPPAPSSGLAKQQQQEEQQQQQPPRTPGNGGGRCIGTKSRRLHATLENFTPTRGLLFSVFSVRGREGWFSSLLSFRCITDGITFDLRNL